MGRNIIITVSGTARQIKPSFRHSYLNFLTLGRITKEIQKPYGDKELGTRDWKDG